MKRTGFRPRRAREEPVEVAILRCEKELGFLDREDDALDPAAHASSRARERRAGRGRRSSPAEDSCTAAAGPSVPRQTAAAKLRGEVDDRRRAFAIARETSGRRRAWPRSRRVLPNGHVGRRQIEAGIEQRAKGEERVGLPRSGLADEGADQARAQERRRALRKLTTRISQ